MEERRGDRNMRPAQRENRKWEQEVKPSYKTSRPTPRAMLLNVSQPSQTAPVTGDCVQIQDPLRDISQSDHHRVVKEGVSKEGMLTVILLQ